MFNIRYLTQFVPSAPPSRSGFAYRLAGSNRLATSGVTLLEVVISAALIGLTILGLASLNSQTLLVLRNQKQNVIANSVLQQRMETFRSLQWAALSDPQQIKAALESSTARPTGLGVLKDAVETISTEGYIVPNSSLPAATGNKSYSVSRAARGPGSAAVSGGAIDSSVQAVRVTCLLQWSEGTRKRQLSHSVVLAKVVSA